ncbi:unnamed protein product [Symbiodinium natans]|uniref:Uncharacterized protein n=1 Tax=Symbiodinium natans TaxID=878477 RepID=A0A812NVN4_9DINO|nr:unnamed protein product [Symbiodinium natans]
MAFLIVALLPLLARGDTAPSPTLKARLAQDDECSARSDDCALEALQRRTGTTQSADALLQEISTALGSDDGLLVRVGAPYDGPPSNSGVSASALRRDLPLALYVFKKRADVMGQILQPGKVGVRCAYPFDGNSNTRQDDEGHRDKCGKTKPMVASEAGIKMSGSCSFSSAEEFAQAYFNKPQNTDFSTSGWWELDSASCHFQNVPDAIAAQKALLKLSRSLPPDTTSAEWLRNASRVGFALTAFNEVITAPFGNSEVAALFWAHAGPFRDPVANDTSACSLADFLSKARDLGKDTYPIVEIAGAALERPFPGCDTKTEDPPSSVPGIYATNPTCLQSFLGEWEETLQGGGYSPAKHFRTLGADQQQTNWPWIIVLCKTGL